MHVSDTWCMLPYIQSGETGCVIHVFTQTDSFPGNSPLHIQCRLILSHMSGGGCPPCQCHVPLILYLFKSISFLPIFAFSPSSPAPVPRKAVQLPVAASDVRIGRQTALCAPPLGHHHYCGHCHPGHFQLGNRLHLLPPIEN